MSMSGSSGMSMSGSSGMSMSGSSGMSMSGSSGMNLMPPWLHIIVAMGRDRAIGQRGTMPWHLPEDLKNFQAVTSNHLMLMGRRTFESLGRVLKNRPHFVVTRMGNADFQEMVNAFANPSGQPVVRCSSLEDFCFQLASHQEIHKDSKAVFLIGGAELYKQALERDWVASLLVTEIDSSFTSADTYFPEVSQELFVKECEGPWLDSVSGLRYRLLRYVRR